jgi:sentrin-specific protease 7
MEPDTEACNPETLLRKNWFDKRNAAKLRDYLRALICELILPRVPAEDADRRQLVQAVVSDYQEKPCT